MKRALIALIAICFTAIAYAAGTMVVDSFIHPDPRIGKRYIQIYLPEGYDPNGTIEYPAIYFLHGAKDGVAPGYANHLSYPYMKGILDALIGDGIIEPIIMAKPNAISSPYVISWHSNSILNGPWENYTYSSIVNFIESNYKAKTGPNYRFLMGHSAGGYGTMRAVYKHPSVFSGLAAHSLSNADAPTFMSVGIPLLLIEYPEGPPYYWNPTRGFFSAVLFSLSAAWTPNLSNPPFYVDLPLDTLANIIPTVMDIWFAQTPSVLVESMPPSSHVRTYFDCGLFDEFLGYTPCCTLSAKLNRLGFEHEYQVFAGGHFDSLPTRFPIGIAFLVGIKATLDFQPTTLNLKSNGKWVTCYIELPGDYSAADIDINSVILNKINNIEINPSIYPEGPFAVGDYDGDGIPDLMVKFNRLGLVARLINMGIGEEEVELGIAGELNNKIPFHDVSTIMIIQPGGGQQEISCIPSSFSLYQGLPNPFEHIISIKYDLPKATQVRLNIYNSAGQHIATLVKEHQAAGTYTKHWNGKNTDGLKLVNGIYICRLETDNFKATRKLLLMR